MSQLLISQYLNQLATLKKVSGTTRESMVREAFTMAGIGWDETFADIALDDFSSVIPAGGVGLVEWLV